MRVTITTYCKFIEAYPYLCVAIRKANSFSQMTPAQIDEQLCKFLPEHSAACLTAVLDGQDIPASSKVHVLTRRVIRQILSEISGPHKDTVADFLGQYVGYYATVQYSDSNV